MHHTQQLVSEVTTSIKGKKQIICKKTYATKATNSHKIKITPGRKPVATTFFSTRGSIERSKLEDVPLGEGTLCINHQIRALMV
jgi:hypothetical protein